MCFISCEGVKMYACAFKSDRAQPPDQFLTGETPIMRKLLMLAAVSAAVLATQSLFAQVVSPNVVGPARRAAAAAGNATGAPGVEERIENREQRRDVIRAEVNAQRQCGRIEPMPAKTIRIGGGSSTITINGGTIRLSINGCTMPTTTGKLTIGLRM